MCLLRNSLNHFSFDNSIFNKNSLRKHFGSKKIDIMFQNRLVHSFIGQKALKQILRKERLASYINYTNKGKDSEYVDFAVNIDINEYSSLVQELQKLPHQIYTVHKAIDSQCYYRADVLGVSLSQMYLKVKGVWTGGHQENSRLRAININHGPADSLWYSVDSEHYERLRRLVMSVFGVDILLQEGLWFCNMEFMLENNIPVRQFRQKAGDIVFLGPGCLHWV